MSTRFLNKHFKDTITFPVQNKASVLLYQHGQIVPAKQKQSKTCNNVRCVMSYAMCGAQAQKSRTVLTVRYGYPLGQT